MGTTILTAAMTTISVIVAVFSLLPMLASCQHENVFGSRLNKCDRPGYFRKHPDQADRHWPTTGYIRNNECTAMSSDAGSHYVCVTMPSNTTSTGHTYTPFWTETGQASSPSDAAQNFPKPGPWCICMWAFARMLAQHPDFINMLDCEATNEWVIEDYDLKVASQRSALSAICSKCAIQGHAQKSSLSKKCAKALAQ